MSEIIVKIYLNHFNFNKKNVNKYFFLDVVVNNPLIHLSSIINRFQVYNQIFINSFHTISSDNLICVRYTSL